MTVSDGMATPKRETGWLAPDVTARPLGWHGTPRERAAATMRAALAVEAIVTSGANRACVAMHGALDEELRRPVGRDRGWLPQSVVRALTQPWVPEHCLTCGVERANVHPGGTWYEKCPFTAGQPHTWVPAGARAEGGDDG
jgi:hypothetical protein